MSEEDSLLRDYVLKINAEQPIKLKIVHLNAQSLRDISHQSEFIDTFSNCGIDIIVVSETWFKNDENVFMLPGYKVFCANRSGRHGGGVAVFFRSIYSAKVLSASTGEFDRPDYILLEILIGTNKILLAAMYRKPKGGYVSGFIDDFYKFSTDYKYSFLCGDLNAGFGRGGEDALIVPDLLSSCNLQRVPFQATYHTINCDSNLDVISSNCPDLLIHFGQTSASGFSDHDLIFATYDLSTPRNTKQNITLRNFSRINVVDLQEDVVNVDWSQVYNERDIDCKVDKFNVILNELVDKHAPLRSKVYRKSSAPWMDSKICTLLKKRNRLRKKFNRTKSPEDQAKFKSVRNTVKNK